MTNEQREAIEICKKKIIEPFYDFPNPTSIELKDTDVRAIEIALSLIKEQQGQWEEIEGLKNINKNQSKDIKKAVDYTFELNKELERKDKQIDLMAECIESLDNCKSSMCDKFNKNCIVAIKRSEICLPCIKQYFERKVKDVKD